MQVLPRVSSIWFQWLWGAAWLWRGLMSGTMTLNADSMRTKVMTKITKEVGNTNKIAPIKRERAHTSSVPQGMTIVGLQSMADLLSLVVLQGIPILRNDNFTVEADHMIMSIDALTHQNVYAFCHL